MLNSNLTTHNLYNIGKKKFRASHYTPLKGNFVPKFNQSHINAKLKKLFHRSELGQTTMVPQSDYPQLYGIKPIT